jgi:hypothetical protein
LNQPKVVDVKPVEGGKISERLEQIKTNSEKWKKRVGELIDLQLKLSVGALLRGDLI